jgi:hypothetical protein
MRHCSPLRHSFPEEMMRYIGQTLSQTPPRMRSTSLHLLQRVMITRQEAPESQFQCQLLLLQFQSLRCLSRLSSPHFYSSWSHSRERIAVLRRRPGEPMRPSLHRFRGRPPESELLQRSVSSALLTESLRGRTLSFSRCSRA